MNPSMNKGHTLIELLLYVAIFAVVSLVAGAIVLNMLFGKAKLTAVEEVGQNGRMALETVIQRVRDAQAVNAPAPAASASTLSLQMADAARNPTVFDLSGGAVRITEGAGAPVALTASEVSVTSLLFSNASYAGTPGTVRIMMTVGHANPQNRQEYSFEKTFYSSATIRKK
ncbi:type II secretion system protein [Candidatus Uhrbacteria bacterium]|nr:type II secretion system protein [Candidatus Uhrbacteria bacterium]